jgi:hypothetical protein
MLETEYGEESYVLLQIHNGADARGGYTDAKLFKLSDWVEPHQLVTDDCSFSIEDDGDYVNLSWCGEWINNDGGCADDSDLAPFIAAAANAPIEGGIHS